MCIPFDRWQMARPRAAGWMRAKFITELSLRDAQVRPCLETLRASNGSFHLLHGYSSRLALVLPIS